MDLREQLQTTLGSAYTLERELGGGGMSRVFVAEEAKLRRKVVVKVLSPELAQGISAERFNREIQVAASLQQANIVPVLSAGESGGLPFYTMPFVEGESVRQRLKARGPMSIDEAISVLRDVARALAYAHERGIVHRDIKPDNVLISGGAAVVTDFGIAKAISAARTDSGGATLTQLGTAIGTPAYISPEQAAGDDVDHRADIYSFAAMAYELISGQLPFSNRTPQRMLAAHMSEAPRPLSELRLDVPPQLAAFVMRCLEKDPAHRPQSASELLTALSSATTTSGGGHAAMPAILLGGPGMWKKALLAYAGAFLVVAVLARAAIVAIGLPEWVFPGALIVMALGLPVILFTAYAQLVTRRALNTSPSFTPGGTPSQSHGTIATMALKASPHLSWRRTTMGGVYAVVAFSLLVGVFMVMRAMGIGPVGSLLAKGALTDSDQLVVADFSAPSADSTLGSVVAEGIRSHLAQSRAIGVMSPTNVADALRRMRREPGANLDMSLAREVAQREGSKAIVAGEIATAGTGFILSARLVAAESGDQLASFREAANGASDLIPAIDRLSRQLRAKIGESLKSVNSSPELVRVTSASLPALRKFTEGMKLHYRDGDYRKAAAAFEEAIKLDTLFATAYLRGALSYRNASFNMLRADTLRRRSYQLRDRLTEFERVYVEGLNYDLAGRRDSAIMAYKRAGEIDPRNTPLLNTLALLQSGTRDHAAAESTLVRAMAVRDANPLPAMNYTTTLVNLGKFDAVRKHVAAVRADTTFGRGDRISTLLSREAAVDWFEGKYDAAAAKLDTAMRQPRSLISRSSGSYFADYLIARGQVRRGQRLRDSLIATDAGAGNVGNLGQARIGRSLDSIRTLFRLERADEAVRRAQAVLNAYPKTGRDGISPGQLLGMASALAFEGKHEMARAILARIDRDVRDTIIHRNQREQRAVITALMDKRFDYVIATTRKRDTLQDGLPRACERCTHADLGEAFDMAGMSDSTIAAFERYIATPHGYNGWGVDAGMLGYARRRLGELYEARGDIPKAAAHYREFVKLWEKADPELQPRVAEVRRRLSRLADVERK